MRSLPRWCPAHRDVALKLRGRPTITDSGYSPSWGVRLSSFGRLAQRPSRAASLHRTASGLFTRAVPFVLRAHSNRRASHAPLITCIGGRVEL